MGATPLFSACWTGHADVVRVLIAAGAAKNQTKVRACRDAAWPALRADPRGMAEAVDLPAPGATDRSKACTLCGFSVFVCCQDDGSSPLYIASFNGHVDAVRTLVESGVALNHALVSW